MPFRFRRSVRIGPGLRLNLGRRGVSASVGGRGGRISLGRSRARATVTVPGSGISYSTTVRRRSPHVTWGSWLICTAAAAGIMWWVGWL